MSFVAKKEDVIERIGIEKEQREAMIASLQSYFAHERDEELGHLAAELLLRHILREIAPDVYNAGIRDAARYITQRLDDIGEIEIYREKTR